MAREAVRRGVNERRFKSGEQWEVSSKSAEGVFVARNGHERLLPLDQTVGFNLYWRDTMPVAIGEHLLITKKQPASKVAQRRFEAGEGN